MADYRVVIVGGGIAGIEGALGLRDLAPGQVATTIVTPQHELVHQPLGDAPWTLGGVQRHPLETVAERLGAELVRDAVVTVDPDAHIVRTRASGDLPYDALLVATGARRVQSLDRAVGFGGALDVPAVEHVLDLVRRGAVERPAIVVPPAAAWSLPAYEVALRAAGNARPVLVTTERTPAEAFGADASAAVGEELDRAGVQVLQGIVADAEPGELVLHGGVGSVSADCVIALPYVRGPRLAGLPSDGDGFVPIDPRGAVDGVADVFAAGDGTTFPIRQGGIAAQQAATAAAAIARLAGADVDSPPLRAVVRGALPTERGPLYLEHDLGEGGSRASHEPLWDPPHRVAGVRMAGFLRELGG